MSSELSDSLALYGGVLSSGLRQTLKTFQRRDGWTLLGLVILAVVLSVMSLGSCGLVFSWAFAIIYPWLMGELVRGSRFALSDVRAAFRRWRVTLSGGVLTFIGLVTVTFVGGVLLVPGWGLLFLFMLLPFPELMALGTTQSAFDTLEAAMDFLGRNWLPWAGLNVAVVALFSLVSALIAAIPVTVGLALGAGGLLQSLNSQTLLESDSPWLVVGLGVAATGLVLGIIVAGHVCLVLRAFLFRALADTTHRTRLFRHRSGAR